jgi:hypothetical protein
MTKNDRLGLKIEVVAAGFDLHGRDDRLLAPLVLGGISAQRPAQIGRMLLT